VLSIVPFRDAKDVEDVRILGKLIIDCPMKEACRNLLSELMFLKSLDKKKWQHKPIWKVHYTIYRICIFF
jgi:hypothetical protein